MSLLDKIAEEGRRQKLQAVPVFTGPSLRDEAIERVDRHADDAWKRAADRIIRESAEQCAEFTSERVLALLEREGVETHDNRALGARFQAAARRGLISKTERTKAAERPQRHCGDVRVWSSNLVDREEAA